MIAVASRARLHAMRRLNRRAAGHRSAKCLRNSELTHQQPRQGRRRFPSRNDLASSKLQRSSSTSRRRSRRRPRATRTAPTGWRRLTSSTDRRPNGTPRARGAAAPRGSRRTAGDRGATISPRPRSIADGSGAPRPASHPGIQIRHRSNRRSRTTACVRLDPREAGHRGDRRHDTDDFHRYWALKQSRFVGLPPFFRTNPDGPKGWT